MNRSNFYAALRGCALFPRAISAGQVKGMDAILNEAEKRGTPLCHLAYILATAYHESASTMQPVRETLARTDDTAIRILERAWKAGKLPWVKTPYWRKDAQGKSWLGRGLVQITHKANYEKFGIVGNPSAALDMPVAVRIIFDGMTDGGFTGKKLSDFITDRVADYYSARAIVNGDKKTNGAKIATQAKAFEKALREAGYDGTVSVKPAEPAPPPSVGGSKAGIAALVVAALASAAAWLSSVPCHLFERLCQ